MRVQEETSFRGSSGRLFPRGSPGGRLRRAGASAADEIIGPRRRSSPRHVRISLGFLRRPKRATVDKFDSITSCTGQGYGGSAWESNLVKSTNWLGYHRLPLVGSRYQIGAGGTRITARLPRGRPAQPAGVSVPNRSGPDQPGGVAIKKTRGGESRRGDLGEHSAREEIGRRC